MPQQLVTHNRPIFAVMLSRKAKHLALLVDMTVSAEARFFASLRFAQNDKVSYIFRSKILKQEKNDVA